MKITHLSRSILVMFALLPVSATRAQVEAVKPASVTELRAFEAETEIGNYFATITAKQKEEGKEKGQIVAAYFIKAVLHRADKAVYPIDEAPNSIEKICADAVNEMPDAVFQKVKTKVIALHGDPHKKEEMLGKYAELDFKKPSITTQIKKVTKLQLQPTGRPLMREASMMQYTGRLNSGEAALEPVMDLKGSTAPAFNSMRLVLRAVHCVDETNPEGGADDMIMSALLIGASGNTNNASGLDCGNFDDGTYRSYGFYPFGNYSLNTKNTYPKVFYAIVQMVEVDSDEEEMVIALNQALYAVGAAVASAWGLGAIVIAVGQAIDLILGFFIDDDAMTPFGIEISLNSLTSMRVNSKTFTLSNGVSPNWRTGNITGHGGTYRVGFKCTLY